MGSAEMSEEDDCAENAEISAGRLSDMKRSLSVIKRPDQYSELCAL